MEQISQEQYRHQLDNLTTASSDGFREKKTNQSVILNNFEQILWFFLGGGGLIEDGFALVLTLVI